MLLYWIVEKIDCYSHIKDGFIQVAKYLVSHCLSIQKPVNISKNIFTPIQFLYLMLVINEKIDLLTWREISIFVIDYHSDRKNRKKDHFR